jgi:hypothetical protein
MAHEMEASIGGGKKNEQIHVVKWRACGFVTIEKLQSSFIHYTGKNRGGPTLKKPKNWIPVRTHKCSLQHTPRHGKCWVSPFRSKNRMHKKKKKKTLLVCNSPGTSGKVPRGVMVLRFYGTHEKHQSSRGVEVGDGFARNLNDSCVTNSARVPQVTAGDPSFSPVFSCAFLWSSCYCQKNSSPQTIRTIVDCLKKISEQVWIRLVLGTVYSKMVDSPPLPLL